MSRDEISIPLEFRRHFISLVKRLLKDSQFSQRFEEATPGYSPYVFNIHFGGICRFNQERDTIVVKPPVYMTFSTGIYDLMTQVTNSAIAMRDSEAVLGLRLDQVHLLPNIEVKSDTVTFRVVGHAVLRGKDGYVDNANVTKIEEAVNNHLKTRLGFMDQNIISLGDNVYSPVRVVEHRGLVKGVCQHYGGKITSVRGQITLEGYPASLQFLYDYGLGVRTGQGFGLLEVVKQHD